MCTQLLLPAQSRHNCEFVMIGIRHHGASIINNICSSRERRQVIKKTSIQMLAAPDRVTIDTRSCLLAGWVIQRVNRIKPGTRRVR